MEQSVTKCRHIKFRRRGITQKKAYNTVITVRTNWTELYPHFVGMMAASVKNIRWWSMKQEVTSVFRELSDMASVLQKTYVFHAVYWTQFMKNSGLRRRHSCCLRIVRGLGRADPPVIRTAVIGGQLSLCPTMLRCNKHDVNPFGVLQTQCQLLSTPQLQDVWFHKAFFLCS